MKGFKFILGLCLLLGTGRGETSASDLDSTSVTVNLTEQLEDLKRRGVGWILSQAFDNYSWPSDDITTAVVALASAADWPAKSDHVANLIVKQLEIELLQKLLRRDIEALTPAKVAFFALAVGAACKDPHNFYGHNLIASLDKHYSDDDFPGYSATFGYSFTSLVTCLSGSHHRKRRIKHLMKMSMEQSNSPHDIDTRATALLALECIRHRHKGLALTNHLHKSLEAIGKWQEEDGSFGNLHTTAVAIQALSSAPSPGVAWNKTAAALALVALQAPNGSFRDSLVATAEAVIAASAMLNGQGLLRLHKGHCSIRMPDSSKRELPLYMSDEALHYHNGKVFKLQSPTEINTAKPVESVTVLPPQVKDLGDVNVTYWLWVGPEPLTAVKHNLTLTVPANTTFYTVMQRAAELASEYLFSSAMWPNGHYIDEIAGRKEEPLEYHYWLLYVLQSDPDPHNPPTAKNIAPKSVDDLLVRNDQVYLFWFQKI